MKRVPKKKLKLNQKTIVRLDPPRLLPTEQLDRVVGGDMTGCGGSWGWTCSSG